MAPINLLKILGFKLQIQVSILAHVHWKLFSPAWWHHLQLSCYRCKMIPMTQCPDVPSCESAFKEGLMQFWNSVEIVWRALDECVGVKWCALNDSLTPHLPGQLSGSFFAIPLRFPCLYAAVSQALCFTHIQKSSRWLFDWINTATYEKERSIPDPREKSSEINKCGHGLILGFSV